MARNSLGNFNFVTFYRPDGRSAPPVFPQTQCDLVQRPGVVGTGVLDLGNKGEPFQMYSGVDILDTTVADYIFQYHQLPVAGRLRLVWNGLDMLDTYQVSFIVLKVVILEVQRLTAKAGGLTAGGNVWLSAMWTLIGDSNERK